MESRAKFLGHPIHPMLIVFPLGLLGGSVIFDALALATKGEGLAMTAYWCLLAGVIGGVIAAVFGFWDWLAIPDGTRAKRVGLWHGIGNMVVTVLFGVSWLLRLSDLAHQPSMLAFGISVLALVIAGVSGWLGGELVDRLAVGVDPGAHLNAPNALSRRPARENDSPVPLRRAA